MLFRISLFFVAAFVTSGLTAQTMTFDTGATEPGFTFVNWVWDGADQVVYPSAPNVNTVMSITKSDGGCWTAISVNPSCWSLNCSPPGGGTWRIYSDKGDEAFFQVQTSPQVINLNWGKIKTLFVQLDDPGTGNPNNTFNFDNVVYDIPVYVPPSEPAYNVGPTEICPGEEVTFNIVGGSLNDGTNWTISSEGCGLNEQVLLGTDTTITLFQTTTFWIRGVDECLCVGPGPCAEPITIEVLPDGCTNSDACNFDPAAVCDNGSCYLPPEPEIAGIINETAGGFFFSCVGGETARVYLFAYDCGEITGITVDGVDTPITDFDYGASEPYVEFISPSIATNAAVVIYNVTGSSIGTNMVFTGGGCTDGSACNFNPDALCPDPGACDYTICYCPADLNDDGQIGTLDLLTLLGVFGLDCGFPYCNGDVNGDGEIGSADILQLLAAFGTDCPPE